MKCRYPTTVGRKDPKKIPITYRCGKCTPCLITRSQIWTGRILMEHKMHLHSAFITLTYDEQHLPSGAKLSKHHAQQFIKDLRKKIYPRKIRHLTIGEYGTEKGRPHYHAVIFGMSSEELIRILPTVWLKGSVEPNRFKPFGELTAKNARYIARYSTKKIHSTKLEGRPKEFQLQSRMPAIGDSYIKKIALVWKGSGLVPNHILQEVPSSLAEYISGIRGTYTKFQTNTIRINGKKYPTSPRFNQIILEALGAEEKQIGYEREIAINRMDEEPIDIDELKKSLIIANREHVQHVRKL